MKESGFQQDIGGTATCMKRIIKADKTFSGSIYPFLSHSLGCGKNNSYYVGIKPLFE